MKLFKRCHNLSVGSVPQWCSCLSGVETYLPGLCCRGAAVYAVEIFSAGTVLQGCSSLNGVETYLPALCCRGAAV